jgi:hypothetical protein
VEDGTLNLTNTAILAIVAPTPDQLHETRLRIPAQMLEEDRLQPTYRTHVMDGLPVCACCGVSCLPHLSICQYRGMPLAPLSIQQEVA